MFDFLWKILGMDGNGEKRDLQITNSSNSPAPSAGTTATASGRPSRSAAVSKSNSRAPASRTSTASASLAPAQASASQPQSLTPAQTLAATATLGITSLLTSSPSSPPQIASATPGASASASALPSPSQALASISEAASEAASSVASALPSPSQALASASEAASSIASALPSPSQALASASEAASSIASALPSPSEVAAVIFNSASPSASPSNAGEETSNGQGTNIVAIVVSVAAALAAVVGGVAFFRRRAAKNKGTVLPGKREGDAPHTPTRGTPARTAVRQGDQQADFTFPARGTDLSPGLRRRGVGANATPNNRAALPNQRDGDAPRTPPRVTPARTAAQFPTGGTGQLSPDRVIGVGAAAAYRTPNRNQDTRTAGDEEGGGSGDTGSTGDDRAALLRSPAASTATATATPRRAWFSPAGLAESIGGVISPIRDKVASLFAGSPDSSRDEAPYAAASQTPTDGSSVSSVTRGEPRAARKETPLPPVIPPARDRQRPGVAQLQQRPSTAQTPESSPVPPPGSSASPTSTSSGRGRGARRARGNRGANGGNQRGPWKSPASPTYYSTPDHHQKAVETVVEGIMVEPSGDRPPSAPHHPTRPSSGKGGAVVTSEIINSSNGRKYRRGEEGKGGGNIVHKRHSPRLQEALAGSPAAPSPSDGTGSLGYSLRNEEGKKDKKDKKGKGGAGGGTRRILVAPSSFGLATPGFPGGMTIHRPVAEVGTSATSAKDSAPSAKASAPSATASDAASSSVTTKFDDTLQLRVGGLPVWKQHDQMAAKAPATASYDKAPAAAYGLTSGGGLTTAPQTPRVKDGVFVNVDPVKKDRVHNEGDMVLLSPDAATTPRDAPAPGGAPTSATVIRADVAEVAKGHSLT